ncbi:MAG: hypothetical protein JNL58_26530 [Planctomyces sp.]|nr:hypothetical protein [Planctomyces sp.]
MNQMFPIGFEGPLAFYLVVYVLTLVVHVFLMAYVLAGSLWLAWVTVFPKATAGSIHGEIPRTKHPAARILRDWLPFALSGAITAGVAPLLFIQILYQQQFYTANVLLGWRWMVVIPVLVMAFYLLYIMKSKIISQWSLGIRIGLSICVAGSFLFVAFCWTTNHLLSLNASQWPVAYETGDAVQSLPALSLRLATWITGTFPAMGVLMSWQLRGMKSRTDSWRDVASDVNWLTLIEDEDRRIAWVSLAAMIASLILAFCYFLTLPEEVRSNLTGTAGILWIAVLLSSSGVMITGLIRQRRSHTGSKSWLIAVTGALFVQLTAAASLREIIRLTQADLSAVVQSTKAAAEIGGLVMFLVFTVLNAGLIAFCLWLVRRKQAP